MGSTQAVEVLPEAAEGHAVCAADAGAITTSRSGIDLTEIGRFKRVLRRAMNMLKG